MPDDKYSHVDEKTALAFLINAMDGGGDKGQMFPYSDAEDLSRGLRFIPGEVTVARRNGETVPFVQHCNHPCCWYWQFGDGSRIYYYEPGDHQNIGFANGRTLDANERFPDGAGECPECGNAHTSGGRVKKEALHG